MWSGVAWPAALRNPPASRRPCLHPRPPAPPHLHERVAAPAGAQQQHDGLVGLQAQRVAAADAHQLVKGLCGGQLLDATPHVGGNVGDRVRRLVPGRAGRAGRTRRGRKGWGCRAAGRVGVGVQARVLPGEGTASPVSEPSLMPPHPPTHQAISRNDRFCGQSRNCDRSSSLARSASMSISVRRTLPGCSPRPFSWARRRWQQAVPPPASPPCRAP